MKPNMRETFAWLRERGFMCRGANCQTCDPHCARCGSSPAVCAVRGICATPSLPQTDATPVEKQSR